MHATIGNHRLRVLPIGKFAITLTPSSADESVEGVRVSIDRKKMSRYPTLASWYDNSPAFRPATMKRQLVDEILAAGRDILSSERVRMKVTPKKRWNSVTCPTCGEQSRKTSWRETTAPGAAAWHITRRYPENPLSTVPTPGRNPACRDRRLIWLENCNSGVHSIGM